MTIEGIYDKSDGVADQLEALSRLEAFVQNGGDDMRLSVSLVEPRWRGQPNHEVVVWGNGESFDAEAYQVFQERIGDIEVDENSNFSLGSWRFTGAEVAVKAIVFVAHQRSYLENRARG